MNGRGEAELLRDLQMGPDTLRIRAAKELALSGGTATIPALLEVLATDRPLVRLVVGFALWRLGREREGLEAVLDALASSSADAREGAVYALGEMGPSAIEFLEDVLERAPGRRDVHRVLEEIRQNATQ